MWRWDWPDASDPTIAPKHLACDRSNQAAPPAAGSHGAYICLDRVQRLVTGASPGVFKVCEKGDAMMAKQATDESTRKFDPMAVPGLSNEARDAVNAAFDAMSTWRTEIVDNSEKNLEQVIEKMAAAARALGWPEQIVDATRSQLQTVTKTQIQMMDQMMDAWEEQIKSPNPSAMLSKLKSLSGFSPAGTWPNLGDMSAMNPMQFSMQFMEQWQKVWSDAMAFWTKAASSQWPRTGT
jgi:hypothetical protein